MRHCNKGLWAIVLISPQKGMFAFEIVEKNAVFCLLASNIWQFLVILKNRLHACLSPFSKHFFGLESWQGSKLTTNTKKSLVLALRGKCLGKKCIFSKFEQIRFFRFYAKTFAKSILECTIRKKAKNPKKVHIFDKSFVKFLWNFCQYFKLRWLFSSLFLLEKW